MSDALPTGRFLTRALAGVSGLVAVTVSAYLTVDHERFEGFLLSTLLWSLILFALLYLLGRCVLSLVKRDARGAGRFALATLAVCVTTIFGGLLWEPKLGIPEPPGPHFRTHTLTGQCEYDAGRDPWYYKRGCSISRDEKIRIVRGSRYPGHVRGICSACKKVPEIKPVPGEDISCADICADLLR